MSSFHTLPLSEEHIVHYNLTSAEQSPPQIDLGDHQHEVHQHEVHQGVDG